MTGACASAAPSLPSLITPEGYALATCADMREYDQLLRLRAADVQERCTAVEEQTLTEIHRRTAAIFAAATPPPTDDIILQWCRANPESIDGQVLALLVLKLQIVQSSCRAAAVYWQMRQHQWQLPEQCRPAVAHHS